MGIPTKGILAPFKNRIGTVVGRRWRAGKWTMNSYQGDVKNPRTTAQMTQRLRFSAAGQLGSAFYDAIDISLNYFLKTHPTTQVGEFVKRNMQFITATGPDSLNVDYTSLTLCKGPLAEVGFEAPGFDTPGQIKVDWQAHLQVASADANDKVYVFVYCPDTKSGFLAEPKERATGNMDITVPQDWNGLKVHLYGFVTSDKTNRKKPNSVSNSLYIGSGNIG